ncbi:MAG: tetratricopeptide repeat protein [Hyphomicrobiales bacterium]|nr:MAG: tetratricopeptide repeat protein [Hyphomicrobiales bacterium]
MRLYALTALAFSLSSLCAAPVRAEGDGRFVQPASVQESEAAQHLVQARALIASGHHLEGIAEQTRAIEINPLDAIAHRERAKAWHMKQRFELAIADYNRALQLAPRDPDSFFGRAISLHASGNPAAAIEDYSRAAMLRPDWSDPYRMRGHALIAQGQYVRAIAEFKRGLDQDPKDIANLIGLGYARLYMGELPVAADNFIRALRLSDDVRAMLFLYIVRARQGVDGKVELTRYADRVRRKTWPYPVLSLYLGTAEPDAVLAQARTEVEQCEAHYYMGQWLAAKGQRAEALASMTQALKRCPKTNIEYEAAAAAARGGI